MCRTVSDVMIVMTWAKVINRTYVHRMHSRDALAELGRHEELIRRRLLGGASAPLNLNDMDERDVWNLVVDTGDSSNFIERYN